MRNLCGLPSVPKRPEGFPIPPPLPPLFSVEATKRANAAAPQPVVRNAVRFDCYLSQNTYPLPSVYLPPYDAQRALVVLAPYAGRAYLFFCALRGFVSFFMSAETGAGKPIETSQQEDFARVKTEKENRSKIQHYVQVKVGRPGFWHGN